MMACQDEVDMHKPAVQRFVAYRRVSTGKQGESGLGLEAQEECVGSFVAVAGGVLVASYTEVETGKTADRPELIKALDHARGVGATLIVAKLDRLFRD